MNLIKELIDWVFIMMIYLQFSLEMAYCGSSLPPFSHLHTGVVAPFFDYSCSGVGTIFKWGVGRGQGQAGAQPCRDKGLLVPKFCFYSDLIFFLQEPTKKLVF